MNTSIILNKLQNIYKKFQPQIGILLYITFLIVFFRFVSSSIINGYAGFIIPVFVMLGIFLFYNSILSININSEYDTEFGIGVNKIKSITTILFFFIFTSIFYLVDPGGYIKSNMSLIFISLILSIFAVIYLVILYAIPQSNSSFLESYKSAFYSILGATISIFLILYLVGFIQNAMSNSDSSITSVVSFILNIAIVVIFLLLLYRTIYSTLPNDQTNKKKNAFFSLLLNLILYIPCVLSNVIDSTMNYLQAGDNATTIVNITLVITGIILVYLWNQITFPSIEGWVLKQGGKLLVNKPLYLNEPHILSNYKDLNGNENYNYDYAISCWVFLDSTPTPTAKYYSILNYGNKPNIQYSSNDNAILFTMDKGFSPQSSANTSPTNQETIIYKLENPPLQKWNNIIVNYQGGVLDIFFNGQLIKSIPGVVPYMSLDSLTIGETSGVKGGIANVIYFKKPLSSYNIFYIYNLTNMKSIPYNNSSTTTIVK